MALTSAKSAHVAIQLPSTTGALNRKGAYLRLCQMSSKIRLRLPRNGAVLPGGSHASGMCGVSNGNGVGRPRPRRADAGHGILLRFALRVQPAHLIILILHRVLKVQEAFSLKVCTTESVASACLAGIGFERSPK